MDSVRVFSEVEIDYSVINGYEDLPSLSDTAYLDDSELEYRMIYPYSMMCNEDTVEKMSNRTDITELKIYRSEKDFIIE